MPCLWWRCLAPIVDMPSHCYIVRMVLPAPFGCCLPRIVDMPPRYCSSDQHGRNSYEYTNIFSFSRFFLLVRLLGQWYVSGRAAPDAVLYLCNCCKILISGPRLIGVCAKSFAFAQRKSCHLSPFFVSVLRSTFLPPERYDAFSLVSNI